jgi:DNA-binding SARP family transcriptional activator
VLRARLAVPPAPGDRIERSWLEWRTRGLIERNRVVLVSAMAGAGKTTTVAGAVQKLRSPVAWLTIERGDADPRRLLTYVEAALAERLPDVSGAATDPLAAGTAPARAAALLAEAVGVAPVVLVLDQLERLPDAPASWEVVESLLRHAPSGMRHVLVSRPGPRLRALETPAGDRAPALLGEGDLAFAAAEAAEVLAGRVGAEADAAAHVAATGGWVTGVLLRAAGGGAEESGALDPTHAYLSTVVLPELAPADRAFLVATALLDEVDARRATALGQAHAAERLTALRAAGLPLSWDRDGDVMRCRPCLRGLLLELLERRQLSEQRALRLAHGRLLAAEGRDEEATGELLCAGAVDEAAATAERAIVAVVERLDLTLAERWLEAFERSPERDGASFVSAELKLALARDDPRHGVRVADRLRRRGRLDLLVGSCPTVATLLAWCQASSGRSADARAALAPALEGPGGDAAGYAAALSRDVLEAGMPPVPAPSGAPLDAAVSAARHLFGRLTEPADTRSSPWQDAMTAPWRIATLRASGRTRRALELHEAARATGTATLALEASVGAEVLIDAGFPDAAREAIECGRRQASAAGSVLEEWRNGLAHARLALRIDRDPAGARAVLDRLAAELPPSGVFRELLDTWYGLALLLESEDDAAVARLRATVERMLAGDRILELPTAAVYLAEAEWRADDEDAADRAADIALDAAGRQGSNHLLLQALADFPAVVSRRIDAEPTGDSPWSDLGRALIAQRAGTRLRVDPCLRLHEFGRCAILVHDEEVRPRLAKTYELLAYLLLRPGGEADRQELLEALFDARADESTRAYLRQVLLCLRRLLPGDADLVDDSRVRLPEHVVAGSDSLDMEARLVEASRLQGDERLTSTLDALELYERGEYLPGAVSAWVLERRRALSDLATDARCDAAKLAFSAGRHAMTEQLTSQVLRADPFRETAWRLAMRLALARGDDGAAVRAYDGCARALARIGTTPTLTTSRLADGLRAAPQRVRR